MVRTEIPCVREYYIGQKMRGTVKLSHPELMKPGLPGLFAEML